MRWLGGELAAAAAAARRCLINERNEQMGELVPENIRDGLGEKGKSPVEKREVARILEGLNGVLNVEKCSRRVFCTFVCK